MGSSLDNPRADTSRGSFSNNTKKSGSIDSFQETGGIHLYVIEKNASHSACLRLEPRGTSHNGGWNMVVGRNARMLLLEYLVNETTITATSQRHSLFTNDRQHLAEWPAHLLDRAIEKAGTPARSGKFLQTEGTQDHWMENGKANGGLDFERTRIWKRKRCTMGFLYLRECIVHRVRRV